MEHYIDYILGQVYYVQAMKAVRKAANTNHLIIINVAYGIFTLVLSRGYLNSARDS